MVNSMQRFVLIAAVLQVVMVIAGHYNEFVLLNLSALLGMGIPLVVAFFYGRVADSMKSAVWGGAIIGFVGAFLGIGLFENIRHNQFWKQLKTKRVIIVRPSKPKEDEPRPSDRKICSDFLCCFFGRVINVRQRVWI